MQISASSSTYPRGPPPISVPLSRSGACTGRRAERRARRQERTAWRGAQPEN